jgi:TPR repeat protein
MPFRRRLPLALLCLAAVAVPAWAADAPLSFDPARHSQAVTDCDRQAGHAEDPYKVGPGVPESKVDLPKAIATCRTDLARDAGNPRLQYQLGRALSYAGQIDEALPLLESAAKLAYPQAQFVLGYLYLDGRLKAPVDRCRALALFRQAATQQRMAAQIGLATWHLDGHFSQCTDPPTTAELLKHLTAARAQKPSFYPELLIGDLERQLGAKPGLK